MIDTMQSMWARFQNFKLLEVGKELLYKKCTKITHN